MVSFVQQFDEYQFQTKLKSNIVSMNTILEQIQFLTFPAEDVDYTYNHKFLLVEYLTNVGILSILQVLEILGLNDEKLKTL